MIQEWMRFCLKKGVDDFKKVCRGIDILNQMDPDGSRPNIAYYMDRGWQVLLDAVEAEEKTKS